MTDKKFLRCAPPLTVSFSVNPPPADCTGCDFSILERAFASPTRGRGMDEAMKWMSTYWMGVQSGKYPARENNSFLAFAAKCESNTRLVEFKEEQTYKTRLISEADLDAGVKGFCPERAMKECETTSLNEDAIIARLSADSEYVKYRKEFVEMRDLVFLDYSIDLARLVVDAYRCSQFAIKKLRELVSEYIGLGKVIEGVVTNNSSWSSDLEELAGQAFSEA